MVNQLYFSPTRTGEQIVKAIAGGIDKGKGIIVDITRSAEAKAFASDDLVLAAVPVYAGRVPDTALERLKKMKGDNTPAAVIAIYGNRAFDDALLELSDIMTAQGFDVIAGAAFIGEHSFSSRDLPIAANRPDSDDLAAALDFGQKLLNLWEMKGDHKVPRIPGNRPYREKKHDDPFSPQALAERCTGCGNCIQVCPVQAVDQKNPLNTDERLCIHCAACVKICPEGARAFPQGTIGPISLKLHTNCSERKEPEFFLPAR